MSIPEPKWDDYAARDICTGCYMKFDYKGECPECDSEEEEEEPLQGIVTFGKKDDNDK